MLCRTNGCDRIILSTCRAFMSDGEERNGGTLKSLLVRFFVAVAASAILAGGYYSLFHERVTAEATSPDNRLTVQVIETGRFIDRNFQVVLRNRRRGSDTILFRSWDQSPAIRYESILWSNDSASFAVVGDAYYANRAADLGNGLKLFLLIHLGTNQLWCNTEYTERDLESIDIADASEVIGFDLLEASSKLVQGDAVLEPLTD